MGDQITIGGPPEFAERAGFGIKALKRVYGAEFKKFQPLDVAGPLTVAALKDNKVQCANLFSTQSAIPANGFVLSGHGEMARWLRIMAIDGQPAEPFLARDNRVLWVNSIGYRAG